MTTLLSLVYSISSIYFGDTSKVDKIGTVTINSTQKKETEAALITVQRKSLVIMDVMSSESINKTPDRTVGDVLKRVGGTSVQNDKFVVVRGLADRYNSVLINGALIGSTEPDKKSFSFDLIGSNTIDNLVILKTASPNLPGEFSGGVIKLTTKVADKKISSFDFGLGYGYLSTFKNSWSVDRFNIPNDFLTTKEFRKLTFESKSIETNKINNSFVPNLHSNIPNVRLGFNYGDKTKKLSYLFSFNFRQSNNIQNAVRQDYMSGSDLMYKYYDDKFTKNSTLNGIVNFKTKRLEYKNTINYIDETNFVSRNGVNYDNGQNIFSQSSNNNKKVFYTTQLIGKKFNLNYSLLSNSQPDYRVMPKAQNIDGGDTVFVWRDSYRFWSKMNEHTIGGSYDDSLGKFKYGIYESFKYRNFDARVFRYDNGFVLNEITNNTDKYGAFSNLTSAYIMGTKKINKLTIFGGLRNENQMFQVYTYNFSGQQEIVDRLYLDLLPSINVVYSVKNNSNLRLSGSRTVARPEFREVSNFAYFDFFRNAQVIGNTKLIKTNIINLDLRYEIFPSSKEIISFSVFGKNFKNPIEQVVDNGSVPSNLVLTLSNPNSAYIIGGEIEIRKQILNHFTLYSNLSVFKSNVEYQNRVRPLQGQSPYIINTGLFYNKNNFSLNVLYNRIGERISAVGFQGYPDIYENARDVLDLTLQYKTKRVDYKIGISDLFGQDSKFYQNNNRNLIRTNNEQTINITINYKL